MYRKILASMLTIVLVFALAVPISASTNSSTAVQYTDLSVVYLEETLSFTPKAYIDNGVTYVPVRSFFQQVGYEVSYDDANKVVHLTYDDYYEASFSIAERAFYEYGELAVEDVKIVNTNNSTYIPIRDIAEFAYLEVSFDPETKTIYLNDIYEEGYESPSYDLFAQPEQEELASQGFLHKFTKNNNTVYVLGSIHAGTQQLYPLRSIIKTAIDESDVFVTEVNFNEEISDEEIEEIEKKYYLADGDSIKNHVSSKTYNAIKRLALKDILDINEVEKMQPWALYSDLEDMVTSNPAHLIAFQLGIDMKLSNYAFEQQKELGGLETFAFQLTLDSKYSQDRIDSQLYDILIYIEQLTQNYYNQEEAAEEDYSSYQEMVNNLIHYLEPELVELIEAWYAGDYTMLEDTYTEYEKTDAEGFKILIADRNVDMANKIEKFLNNEEEKTYFVVIGALHVVGDKGVIKELERRGYKPERL